MAQLSRFWMVLTLALGMAAGVIGLATETRVSFASCVPSRLPSAGNYFSGAWNTGFSGTVGGAYVQIQRNDPYLYGSGTAEVSDWVMLAGSGSYSPPGGNRAQFGWAYSQQQGARVFSEVSTQTDWERKFGPAPANSNVPTFTVLYNFVPGRFTFQLNGAQWIPAGSSGGYNPSAYLSPHDVHSFGEIQDAADQMPGGNNNRTGHYGAHLYYNGVWQEGWLTTRNGGFNLMVDPPGGNLGYYNGQQFYIWDGYCST